MLSLFKGELLMSHITFDTLKFVERLKESGMPEIQAKALAEVQQEVFSEALDNTLATKKDLIDVKDELKDRITKVEHEINLMKWMLGFVFAGVFTLILKAFF
jgi:hypothetical protein